MPNKRNRVTQKQDKGKFRAQRRTKKRRNMKFKVGDTMNPAFELERHCNQPIKREHVIQKKGKLIQGKLKAQRKTKKRRNMKVKVGDTINPASEPVSNIFKNAHEDILFEIFLRLPEYRSVVLCGVVCPQWHSVISQPQFVPSYIRHCNSRPYNILFYKTDTITFISIELYQPILSLHSKESLFLHKNRPCGNWDFMPSRMIIRASLDDLLLVSPGRRSNYYICNPISRQWVQLPKSDGICARGFALVRNKLDQYKVVLVPSPFYENEDGEDEIITFSARVFCSSSGQWTISSFSYTPPRELLYIHHFDVVTCNGVLYWLENELSTFERIFFFDVFNDQWGIIEFPDDLVCGRRNSYGKVYLGLVCGELRLVQIVKRYKSCFVIKVWKLQHADTTCWVLINETNLTRPNTKKLNGFAVHPNHGDLVFMIWGRHVFQHMISTDTCVEAVNLAFSVKDPFRVVSTPLLHPPLPTPVPLLPSSI